MTTTNNKVSRHDYPREFRALLDMAVELDVVDAIEIGVLMMNADGDASQVADYVMECAFADRHGSDNHKTLGPLFDAFGVAVS